MKLLKEWHMSRKLFLFPYGGNSREALLSVFAINQLEKEWDVIGFLDDDQALHGKECCGMTVVGGRGRPGVEPDGFVLAAPGSPETYFERADAIAGFNVDEKRVGSIADPSLHFAPDSRVGLNRISMAHVFSSRNVPAYNHSV